MPPRHPILSAAFARCDWPAILAVIGTIAISCAAGCSHPEVIRTEGLTDKAAASERIAKHQDQSAEASLAKRRWLYAEYFHSVKDRVRKQWSPAGAYRRRDPAGTVYGQQERYTLLGVRMNDDGSLADVWVVHTCGLEWLDETAIEAFARAQPFAPPPRGLVQPNGMVEFSFGFFFDAKEKGALAPRPGLKPRVNGQAGEVEPSNKPLQHSVVPQ